ncbi:MAG TPA: hypothetical protein VKA86_03100 [Candidatus Krumholzibacteria bacterium]|nr:hypothetical protein [Candidatus Krumholzibacteria bacterium]
MLQRHDRGPHDVPSYEIETPDWSLRLSPREFCQLACELESWFRENREQLIDDVCRETAQDENPELGTVERGSNAVSNRN